MGFVSAPLMWVLGGKQAKRQELKKGDVEIESAEIDFLYGPNLVRYMTDSEYSKNKYFIVKVPINSFYVLGDNWYNSDDSRRFGCVNKEDILFKVIN